MLSLYLEWGALGPLAQTAPPQACGATVLDISQEPGLYLPAELLPQVNSHQAPGCSANLT